MSRLLAVTLLSLFFAAPVGAQTLTVFHDPTNTGTNPGAPGTLPIGPGNTPINLFYTGGPNPTPDPNLRCNTPGNHEVCALDWLMTATGGVSIQPGSWTAAPGSDWVVRNDSATTCQGNGGNPLIGEGYPTPTKIGTLLVTANGPGTVQLTYQAVNSGLNLVSGTPTVLVIAGGVNDFDGDLVLDPDDSCPTVANIGDPDNDGVDNACDNCSDLANPAWPVASSTANRHRTGGGIAGGVYRGQLDDDVDGRGNRCDFDYNQGPVGIGGPDNAMMQVALGNPAAIPPIPARNISQNNCGTAGTSACGIHDNNENAAGIGGPDNALLQGLLTAATTNQNGNPLRHCGLRGAAPTFFGTMCSTNPNQPCCSPFSRPLGGAPGPFLNKAICLNATGVGAPQRCVYAN